MSAIAELVHLRSLRRRRPRQTLPIWIEAFATVLIAAVFIVVVRVLT